MRWALVVAALAVVALGVFLLRSPTAQDRLLERVIDRAISGTSDALLDPDALRVLVCGSGSPLPHPERAGPCVAVFAAGRFWVVDTGLRSWNNLALWRVPGDHIGAVLLTHFHSDHIGELGEFDLQTWVAGRPEPLRVFGPRGVERVVNGFEEAYALDTAYRIAHHGADFLPAERGRMRPMPLPDAVVRGPVPVLEEDGLRVTAFPVDHDPVSPAVGYRFDYRGRSAVVSGDTAEDPRVVEAARGADVLLHDVLAPHLVQALEDAARRAGRDRVAHILDDIPDYHATPVQAARTANAAGVRLLLLTHLVPPPPQALVERIFVRGVDAVRPDGWMLAEDGLLVELPAGAEELSVRRLD